MNLKNIKIYPVTALPSCFSFSCRWHILSVAESRCVTTFQLVTLGATCFAQLPPFSKPCVRYACRWSGCGWLGFFHRELASRYAPQCRSRWVPSLESLVHLTGNENVKLQPKWLRMITQVRSAPLCGKLIGNHNSKTPQIPLGNWLKAPLYGKLIGNYNSKTPQITPRN